MTTQNPGLKQGAVLMVIAAPGFMLYCHAESSSDGHDHSGT